METVKDIATLLNWMLGLLTGALIIRCISDIFKYSKDSDYGIGYAVKKIKTRVFAAVIALTITGTVAYIRSFYQ